MTTRDDSKGVVYGKVLDIVLRLNRDLLAELQAVSWNDSAQRLNYSRRMEEGVSTRDPWRGQNGGLGLGKPESLDRVAALISGPPQKEKGNMCYKDNSHLLALLLSCLGLQPRGQGVCRYHELECGPVLKQ